MKKQILPLFVIISFVFLGWGRDGHVIINGKTALSFPQEMNYFLSWSDSLVAHGSDADYRKSWDPTEAPKHYIDIDNYSTFNNFGYITQSYDSAVALYGYQFVIDQGTLPWAILWTYDSLKSALMQKDWHKAMLLTADLGHYVGDAHMPLHITRNYNGQYTGQTGVHSRYESSMIGKYKSQIVFEGDSVNYIEDVPGYVFNMVYYNYLFVDSVLLADLYGKNASGGSYNNTYYLNMWSYSKNFTIDLFRRASISLAELFYSCWIDAGMPLPVSKSEDEFNTPQTLVLNQNYPNPFNPETTISFSLNKESNVNLKVFDITGKQIRVLLNNEIIESGEHIVRFNASGLSSGVYYYSLTTGDFNSTKKMVLVR
ncbi:MAG TPA: T9SS type A sorting domain-containing protein [Ignavibacteriaceae bacterium]|nr:T9SS type A sorting domain-containing protein [Ignavibacteriaceae bacterium]